MGKMKKITTYSGAVYYLYNDRKITGGSKKLRSGELLFPLEPIIGVSMMISAPERGHLNPRFEEPGVTTSYVVKIEEVYSRWDAVKMAIGMFIDSWRARNA